ncbi:glycosyltransferase [Melittangium boletus]|uniref:O-antigen biosynthesis protein n=1 Tax=Melittangium boletus DSM 14713 TaxID=1294270 RepID=A0A250ITK3_9BACT|nr:glycosyltransferase [Melittangium boletus]ATB34481.1 O-antigen biosynthesis protein [Melittangium boletus DSM 14713]
MKRPPSAEPTQSAHRDEPPLASLPEFDGDGPPVVSGSPSLGDLAEMVAAQKRLLQTLIPCTGATCQDLPLHQRTLRLLTEELRRRLPDGAAKAHTPLQAAQQAADVFQFQVPPSHRKQLGRAVTAAKTALVEGLKPFHIELLRPQHAFNHEMVAVLEQLSSQRATSTSMDLSDWVRRRLEPVSEPTRWRIQSHRKKGLGAAVQFAKKSYLQALQPVLGQVLERQRRWNEAAVRLLVVAARPRRPEPQECQRLVAELHALANPLDASGSLGLRASAGLWREVFRRQTAFNYEVTLCLANALETRPPVEARVDDGYPEWCAEHEPALIARAAEALTHLTARPLVSLVVAVDDPPEPLLRACIESVLAQSYEHWELCLVDDGSQAPHVRELLARYARQDRRIRVQHLPSHGGIAHATNAAIALAEGEFVGFLEQEDTLAPHALAEVVLRLAREPDAELIYSDEDRLDASGGRFGPFFKPDWSPDLLRSVNYLHHFVVVRRAPLTEAGGMREGFEEARNYELLLRLSERVRRIVHVPGILYHARASDVPASDAGVRALREHLARRGEVAEVSEVAPAHYRVRYPVRGTPLVSIIVPFKDKPELLRMLTGTLLEKTRYPHFELLLVSNNSTQPETFEVLESLTDPRIRKLTWDHPFNYPAINNFAAREARGELLLFLNNDMEIVDPEWLDELIGQAQRPEVGAVGAKLLFPDRTVQHAGAVVGITGFAGHPFWRMPDTATWTPFGHADWVRNYLAVTSACVMLRRELFEQLEGYDERFLLCGSDVDLGLRLVARGLRVVYTPHTRIIHHESASRRMDAIPENDFWRSFSAYRPYLGPAGDPFYNPFLTLQGTDCSLRRHEEDGEALAVRTLARDLPSTREEKASERALHQRHVADHVKALDHSSEQVRRAREEAPERLARLRSKGRIERVSWFLPSFHHPYGGIHTLLRFADLLRSRHGVQNDLIIYNNPNVTEAELEARVAPLYPNAPGRFRVLRHLQEVGELPECDLAVATMWTSAYPVLSHPRATVRAYFVQDYEPQFFAAGTYSALAEQTYRLGLYGIFNTSGLYEYVTSHHPMQGCWFEPTVDRSVFHDARPARKGPVRIFFYGRPSSDRNAFELGISALRQLKAERGAAVEILTAGERWNPAQYGLDGVITNLGVLPYEKTADLYRECDVGLCFMFTKHPSYLPFEMMACGVTVVTNDNPSNLWLLEHGKNCLLAEPTYSCVLEQLRTAVADPSLRARIRTAAVERVLRTTWEAQVDRVHDTLVRGETAAASPRRASGQG